MTQKRILFLGAASTQLPPINYAKEQGHYVITSDYIPDNPGHLIADECYDISTINKEAILVLAERLKIDGIVAYASDPAAPTAAYVADKMGLVGNPFLAVETLVRKDLFRRFLAENNFNVPKSKSFEDIAGALDWLDEIGLPVFVKPVDSSGSKGVTRIENKSDLSKAFESALSFSITKKVVVEKAIERIGYQVDSDIFMANGEVIFWIWGDQHQDKYCHEYAPIGISFPSILSQTIQNSAYKQIESILQKLDFKSGAFNVEFVVDENDDIWVIEIGPRNGGNLIPEVIKYATGVDMVAMTVDLSIGKSVSQYLSIGTEGFWSSYIVHARDEGVFDKLEVSERAVNCIVKQNIAIKEGESVCKFSGSHNTLGTMIMRFDTKEQMLEMLDNMENDILVITK